MTSTPHAVSVVMRSFNEAWAIRDTIHALKHQNFPGEIEWIVIDSGSSDGSIDIIRNEAPDHLIQIPLGTYVPGVVLNQGARTARHDWIVYLNADATPTGPDWLSNLLDVCASTPDFGAGFSRQIPRPDCLAVFAHDYDRCFGPNRQSVRWDHFFSMVSSATHRSVLDQHPFREDLQYAEDDEWTRRLAAHGLRIPYAETSVVVHSHNYTLKQSYKRAFGDAKALAAAGSPGVSTPVPLGWLADTARDAAWCLRHFRPAGIPYAAAVRLAQRLGRRDGERAGTPARTTS